MLDVHAPNKPFHGAGEFFLHLFTITVGLLIAVGIEGLVTWHEHRKLAEDAREMMTAEIRHNQANVEAALRANAAEEEKLKKNLQVIEAVQKSPNSPSATRADLDISYQIVGLEHTAWRTAQATGALSYMPYDEAQKFSGIYEAADNFEKAEAQWTEDEAQFLGLIRRYLSGDRLTLEGANAMAQEFGVWQGHMLTIGIAVKVLAEQNSAFLEGREPIKHMSEMISN
jgi:hypothetical protein